MPGATSVSPASTTRATHAPCAASAANRAAPGAITLPGAAGGDPALERARVGGHHRGVRDLGHRLARAHDGRRVERVGHRAGLARRVLGRRLQRAAHRLQALEQRPALRAPARRQRDHRLALGARRRACAARPGPAPTGRSCARAGRPCPGARATRRSPPRARAGSRRRAGRPRPPRPPARPHGPARRWRRGAGRGTCAAGRVPFCPAMLAKSRVPQPPWPRERGNHRAGPSGPGANRHHCGVARRREPASSPRRRTRQRQQGRR